MKSKLLYYLGLTTLVSTSNFIAQASPVVPWFDGQPRSVHLEFDFSGSNPTVPNTGSEDPLNEKYVDADGKMTFDNPFPDVDPLATYDPSNNTLRFDVPNWPDEEPAKFAHIHIYWQDLDALPSAIEFLNAIGIKNGDEVPGQLVHAETIADPYEVGNSSSFLSLFYIDFYPNPDWELFLFGLPGVQESDTGVLLDAGIFVEKAYIDTISTVPEPATIALFAALALTVFCFMRRRRS